MASLSLMSIGKRLGWAAAAFALLLLLPRAAAAGRGAASTRSDGGVSRSGTGSASSSHGSSSGSSSGGSSHGSSGGSAVPRGSSHGDDGGASSGRDSGPRREGDESGRVAVPRAGGSSPDPRQPNDSRSSGRHHGGHRGGGWVGGTWWGDPWYYGYGGYGPGWGWGWGWGWGSGWWWPWGPAGVMYDRPYRDYRDYRGGSGYGALDLDVAPEDAEIYVDGDRVGVADDFDGFPTYLWLPRGTYDVVIYRPGFQTIARQYSMYDSLVIDVNDRMERGDAVRPEDLPAKTTARRDERLRRNAEREADAARRDEDWRQRRRGPASPALPPTDGASLPRADRGGAPEHGHGNGSYVHLRVRPADASVYIDGSFAGTAEELGALSAGLLVTPGSHRLEVVRPGYQAESLDFDSTAGEDLDLKVELDED
jgi:hypothetical protein